jgi:hypothetical protein
MSVSNWSRIKRLVTDYRSGKVNEQKFEASLSRLIGITPDITALVASELDHSPILFFYLAPFLSLEQIVPLTDSLIAIYLESQGWTGQSREILLRLPRRFLIQKMKEQIDVLRQKGTYWEFRRFLELANSVDHELRAEVAEIARNSDDSDIQEAGEDFAEPIDETSYRPHLRKVDIGEQA